MCHSELGGEGGGGQHRGDKSLGPLWGQLVQFGEFNSHYVEFAAKK